MSSLGIPVRSVPDSAIDLSQPLKVYWAPGCTACLRMKEFLARHGVPYQSVNAVTDAKGRDELAMFGLRRVPIAARGAHWADGQVLRDLARIAGIRYEETQRLTPEVLLARGLRILEAAIQLLARISDDRLDAELPGRQRTYKQLGCHVFQIVEVYLDLVERGRRVEMADYLQPVPGHVGSSRALQDYGNAVRRRLEQWRPRMAETDFAAPADVYYGEQSLHEFLERTVWHAAQHTRQIEAVVRRLGLTTAGGLTAQDLAGLPVPDNVYDDEIVIR